MNENFPFCESFFPLNGVQEAYAKAIKYCHENPAKIITIVVGKEDGSATYFIGWNGTPSYQQFFSWAAGLISSDRIKVLLLSAEKEGASE